MDYYGNNDWRDYLAHYGVKGMKWKNHKYLKKIGDWYDYNITGQGYLRDADKWGKRARAAQDRADKDSNFGYGDGPKGKYKILRNRWYSNSKAALNDSQKAHEAYYNYRTKSLAGKREQKKGTGIRVGSYSPYKKQYENLSEMNSTRRKLKRRQRKEKVKAVVNKVLGKKYNSSPANSQKALQVENFIREKKIKEKKIKEKKIKEKKS